MADDVNGPCHEREETEAEVPPRPHPPSPLTNGGLRRTNGQCVLAMPSLSLLNPSFDLTLCHTLLDKYGFQIPESDLIGPLMTALDPPPIRRYMVFNSSLFHFVMAPVLYMVIWCALFSTIHRYMTISDYWVLCLCITLIDIFLTAAIIFALHHGNKEMNMNVDVRLIQVNERMIRHKLLVGVADWVQNCSGTLQLFFVYWDMTSCFRTLSRTLESFGPDELQRRLNMRLSHLVLLSEVRADTPSEVRADTPSEVRADTPSEVQSSDEERPLLAEEETTRSTATSLREDAKLTKNHTLTPDAGLPAQATASQLLLSYSSVYARLLVSKRLQGPTQHHLRPRQNHCSTAPLCLCQYIKAKVL